ncbi:MAG: formate--tetrahydrofolate ligase [Alphaproteobacteria bacterium]|nr:formate--tetrahydrofolate ligase [Alphaproteobacteria bacterium]
MKTDIEIANLTTPFKINQIANKLNLTDEDLEPYGHYKAKISNTKLSKLENLPINSNLILITAITPTPAGEGKSTVSIGLADAFHLLNKKVCLSLREPSLGPCFGIKGGATGGGYSQVIPMQDINLNFTGDIHAITSANNLLSAMIDNHIKHGNSLNFEKVFFKRCLDLNDRALREVEVGRGNAINGPKRTDNFNISVASEIMAILCLSKNYSDLKQRLNKIVIGQTKENTPIYAKDLKATGAMASILKDALLPNLVQTLEHTPAIIHGGPFANIAHGTSSYLATTLGLKTSEYVITEAGFGADLGAEKFFNIFGRITNIFPKQVVIVATIRALKMHGGVSRDKLNTPNLKALEDGFSNLETHIENIKKFGYNPIVAINKFITDTKEEEDLLINLCNQKNTKAIITNGWKEGGKGCINLANAIIEQINSKQNICHSNHLLYSTKDSLYQKIETIAKTIYRAKDVNYTQEALKDLEKFISWGYNDLPICIAKTQNSISHDKTLLGSPKNYTFPITELRLSAGAGFIVALSGEINTMPGLPQHPAAENIDIDDNGNITGLF